MFAIDWAVILGKFGIAFSGMWGIFEPSHVLDMGLMGFLFGALAKLIILSK